MNRPLRVFLCHSSNDKPAVRELYQKLRAEAWIQPWLDEEELYPGQDWNMEIEKAIGETDVIIVCLSKGSTTKEGYVQKEIKTALDFSDYKPEGTVFIIPIRLEDCTPPNRLSKWQYADYFEGQRQRALQRLLVSLKRRADSLDLISQVSPKSNFTINLDEIKPVQPAEWQVREPPSELDYRVAHTFTDNRDVDGKWYVCGASRRGKSHENQGSFREDACRIESAAGWILVAVADGAGSHQLSRLGSNLAVKIAIYVMTEKVENEAPSNAVAMVALQETLREVWSGLYNESVKQKVEFQSLSTTLLLLMFHPVKNLIGVAQIGDGLIAAQLESGDIALLSQSESVEFSGVTYFIQSHKIDDLLPKCRTPEVSDPIKYFFVMTDGVSDDLYPPQERLLGLIKTIPSVMANERPDRALLELINYTRPGSLDDRTLVVVCKRKEVAQLASN